MITKKLQQNRELRLFVCKFPEQPSIANRLLTDAKKSVIVYIPHGGMYNYFFIAENKNQKRRKNDAMQLPAGKHKAQTAGGR